MHEVDEIDQQWLDYDTMDVEDEDMINEEALHEAGPDAQDDVRRRVAARKRQPAERNQKQQREPASLPTTDPDNGAEPLCDYEQIRESNIRASEALVYEKFGYHLRDGHGILTELLGQEEGDSDEEEQV